MPGKPEHVSQILLRVLEQMARQNEEPADGPQDRGNDDAGEESPEGDGL